jgi:hypothetical protein
LTSTNVTCTPADYCADVTEIPQVECEALAALYDSTDGPGWTDNSGWLLTDTPCSWFGILCSPPGHVSHIDLGNNNLAGSIPSQLGNLPGLDFLQLGYNHIEGSIPPQLGNLSNLTSLSVHDNNLGGPIPPELGSLPALERLVLSENQLTGNIPVELGSLANLTELYLHDNQLDGSIPAELGDLSGLQYLYLRDNTLNGPIPSELGGLSQLEYLILSGNQLDGAVPSSLGNLQSLRVLTLYTNMLSGGLPEELGILPNLGTLRVDNNAALNGPVPAGYASLDLSLFYFDNTDLCEPDDPAFQSWLEGIAAQGEDKLRRTSVICPSDPNDQDGDGVFYDNAPTDYNPDQSDLDGDGVGDVADPCPADLSDTCNDQNSAAVSVGTTGGTLDTPSGAVNMTIPAGALSADTSMSITDNGSGFALTTDSGQATAVFGVIIGPPGTAFAQPVTIRFQWDDVDDDGIVDSVGVQEAQLFIAKDGVTITGTCSDESPPDGVYPDCDMAANYLEIQVSSLSEFAVAVLPGQMTGPSGPVQTGTAAEVRVDFFDIQEAHNLTWDWGDGAIESKIDFVGNPVIHSHAYQVPGIYTLELIIAEDTDDERTLSYQYIVVYDPEGGFVTGGGWIWSPQGAYHPDPALAGKAIFGFVSKYRKGATEPIGNTEFQFQTGELSFHSTSYDWLVVNKADSRAQFKGLGPINGEGEYKFMLWAGDGSGPDGADTFRIKIWWEDADGEHVVYDNGTDQAIAGGSIEVHMQK